VIKARRRLQPLCAAVLHSAGSLTRHLANYPVPRTNSSHDPSHYTLFAPRYSHFTIALPSRPRSILSSHNEAI